MIICVLGLQLSGQRCKNAYNLQYNKEQFVHVFLKRLGLQTLSTPTDNAQIATRTPHFILPIATVAILKFNEEF